MPRGQGAGGAYEGEGSRHHVPRGQGAGGAYEAKERGGIMCHEGRVQGVHMKRRRGEASCATRAGCRGCI